METILFMAIGAVVVVAIFAIWRPQLGGMIQRASEDQARLDAARAASDRGQAEADDAGAPPSA